MPENASGGFPSSSSLLIRGKNPGRCQAGNPLKLLSEFAGLALSVHGDRLRTRQPECLSDDVPSAPVCAAHPHVKTGGGSNLFDQH